MLQIFKRRFELPATAQVAFIADQDIWVNTGVPSCYSTPSLLFTDGYSIENDVICDGNLEGLLVGTEAVQFKSELNDFVDWYALALTRHLDDPTKPISTHPRQVLDPACRSELLALKPGESYPTNTRTTLLADYNRLVRGKSLLGLLINITNSRPRQPKHTDRSLLEMVAARPGPKLNRFSVALEALFSP